MVSDHVLPGTNLIGRMQHIARKDRLEVYPCVALDCNTAMQQIHKVMEEYNVTQRNVTQALASYCELGLTFCVLAANLRGR